MEKPATKTKPIPVEAKLIHKKSLTHDVVEFHFQPTPSFHFEPGQFVSVLIPGAGPGGRDLRRAYSIASEPEKAVLELCVKIVEGGPGTQYLNQLKIGDSIKGIAPYGDFVFKTHHQKHVIFVATGTGIAPFRSMVFSKVFAAAPPLTTTLLFGARDENDLLYTEEMKSRLNERGFIQAVSRNPETKGFKGRVTDWLRQNEAHIAWKDTEFYLCGNGAMIDEAKLIIQAHGVEKTSIHQEVYYKPKPGEVHASS